MADFRHDDPACPDCRDHGRELCRETLHAEIMDLQGRIDALEAAGGDDYFPPDPDGGVF